MCSFQGEKKKTSPGGKSRQQSATPSLRCNIATATNRFFFQMGKHGGGGGGFVFVVVNKRILLLPLENI
jgi:hypothetical protein